MLEKYKKNHTEPKNPQSKPCKTTLQSRTYREPRGHDLAPPPPFIPSPPSGDLNQPLILPSGHDLSPSPGTL